MTPTNIKYAMCIMAFAALYLFCVTFVPISVVGNEHAKTIVGFILGSAISVFLNYYWGSSKKLPADSPIDETAKIEAAKIESDRIAAAKADAEKAEQKRIDDAKVTAADVIQAAKTETEVKV